MTKYFSILSLLIVVGCTNNRQKSTNQQQDTKTNVAIDSNISTNPEKDCFVLRGSYENRVHKLQVFSHFLIPEKIAQDSSYYFQGNILSVTNKQTTRNYKIQISDPCSDNAEILINNVTNSLGFKEPLFEITTPDCSDWFISEFIQLKKDSLKKLFDISDTEPVKLAKTNENTLVGTVKDRDELVGDFQDYPITVSLLDYSVKENKPLKQKIDFESEALEDIHGYRVPNSGQIKKQYLIRKGQKLIVDSLFRDTKEVLLIIQDTILVICPMSNAKDKLQGNAAG
jgi:hypothetical protein